MQEGGHAATQSSQPLQRSWVTLIVPLIISALEVE
jgi:hypothetical protein